MTERVSKGRSIRLCAAVILLAMLICACGAETTKSYTFSVDTGDKIEIELTNTDGYDLTSELPFAVSLNGQVLSQGKFVKAEAYDQFGQAVSGDPEAEILDEGTKDGNEFLFWSYGGVEFNYVIRVKDSSTAVLIGNAVSEASAKECFERLSFAVAE